MILPGLISVTFRQLMVEEIAALAAECGLRGIEWGGDVHVPPGDADAAARAMKAAADNGLTVTGYGSYFRAGDDDAAAFAPVVDAAATLGAPTIRVWAGSCGTADADDAHRRRVSDGISAAVEQAAAAGITVALELHGGTLTDTAAGAVALCDATGARSHWQPAVGASDTDALADLDAVADRLAAAHVFSWDGTGRRLPLAARADLWLDALRRIARLPGEHPALLEFVADDDPDNLRRDADALHHLLAQAAA